MNDPVPPLPGTPPASGVTPPAPPPSPKEPEPEPSGPRLPPSGPSNVMEVTFGHAVAKEQTFAGVLNQYYDQSSQARTFSVELAPPLSDEEEEELLELFVIEESHAEKLIVQLESHRVLVIEGDRRCGKASAAKYVATRLANMRALHNSTRVVEPLERPMRVILRNLAEDEADFGKRVTIFKDAFANRNRDLMTFFTSDRAAWDDLCHGLRKTDSYLIFTTETAALFPIRSRLSERLICHELPPLPNDRISTGIDRKLARLRKRKELAAREVILSANRERLIAELKTLPRIQAFIDDFVRADPDCDFETALARFDTASHSFLVDLEQDVDAWCFAVTLALTEAAPDAARVPWSDFERLRRIITERIKSDTEIFPRRRLRPDQDIDEGQERPAGACLADDSLLTKCRARVEKDGSDGRDVVFFAESSRTAEVWQTLLKRNRRVLSAIVPLLRDLAEKERGAANYTLRALAAQVLGRIGEMDPSIALPLILWEWVGTPDFSLRPLVGRLLQGILASGNARYQQEGLEALERLAAVSGEDPDDDRGRLVTAIAAYAHLGDCEEAKALMHLGEIAIEHVVPGMAKVHETLRQLEQTARAWENATSGRRAAALRTYTKILSRKTSQMLDEQEPYMAALNQALSFLCATNEPVQILTATRDWISKGGAATGALVAVLFLRPGGIADQLEAYGATIRANDGSTTSVSTLLFSLASGRKAVIAFCGFLGDVYTCLGSAFSLPAELQHAYRERFAECLTTWARGSTSVPACREAVENLCVALASLRGGVMRPDIYSLFDRPAFGESDGMRAVATAVRKRIG